MDPLSFASCSATIANGSNSLKKMMRLDLTGLEPWPASENCLFARLTTRA